MLSGLLHHLHRSEQPLRNTVVRIPGPSCVEKCWILRTIPFNADAFVVLLSMAPPQFPSAMPRDRAVCTNTLSAGTVRTLLIASANGTKDTSGGWKATITPD